ncbi:MAG: serine hydrolase [Vulcanimicrobiaceae bacterium]
MRLTDLELARLVEQSGLTRPAAQIISLQDSASLSYRANRPLYPASMIKVPLVAAALILRDHGEIAAGPHRIDASNLTTNDGPSPLIAGYPSSLDELCTLAIVRSDNIATNQLFDVAGRERATAVARAELGLLDTGLRRKLSGGHPLLRDPAQCGRNTHPASDAATLMRAIATGSFPGASFLFSLLERQEWNTKLSAGIGASDHFAHKTGDTEEVSHDGGILVTESGERFVIVVYSASPACEATDALFAALMRALRSLLEAHP